jgi:sugar/nucleoside kinase (ribokinase family)
MKVKNYKIIAIGDNVCDKYLSRGKMYPGGQCVNTCVYVTMNGAKAAYLGKYGDDEVAECVHKTLEKIGIDDSHSRHFQGENGFALVTLKNSDRVFLGSNKGGIAKEYAFDFDEDDFAYIKDFQLIYTNLNSYIEDNLSELKNTGVPIAYDFSMRWTDEYLEKVCPYVTVAILSCAHLTPEKREEEMRKVQSYGVKVVLGTVGEDGSYVLYKDQIFFANAVHAEDVIDTMGAGDSYFSAFLCSLLDTSKSGQIVEEDDVNMEDRLKSAMDQGAAFAAKICALEGAFGYGVPIVGKTEI